MNHYFITGTSRGLGKAMAEYFLEEKENFITGISRSKSIEHTNYKHQYINLADTEEVKRYLQIAFNAIQNPSQLVLINNAGRIGQIAYIGEQDLDALEDTIQLNFTTSILIINQFLKKCQHYSCPKYIINISSGAGRKAYDGWANYCATKAALDMFSEAVAQEQKIRQTNVRIFSIAPGVVDTDMQTQIREATNTASFANHKRFVNLKNEGQLSNPMTIAKKIAQVIENPSYFDETLLDVRAF